MFDVVKRVLVGRPLASTQMEEQRITKKIALGVISHRTVQVESVDEVAAAVRAGRLASPLPIPYPIR